MEREGRDAESGSDGEDICDPPIRPAFNTTDELPLVKYMFTKVFTAYRSAMSIGLYNAVGKEFMRTLGDYSNLCLINPITSPFLFLASTSTGFPQPGALYVTWELPPRVLRSKEDSHRYFRRERYADYVVYDTHNALNVIVVEVKQDEAVAIELQNNEQMLGLWKEKQRVMLGLETRAKIVWPKILLRQNNTLQMYYLQSLYIKEDRDLATLLKLLMAFLVLVDYCY